MPPVEYTGTDIALGVERWCTASARQLERQVVRVEALNATRPLCSVPYTGPMSVQHFVDEQGRYDGKTL
jgi:hypothetical protein